MAHSKVRWISTPTFLACVGGAHDRREGANVCEGARMAKGGGRARLGGEYAPLSQPYAPHSLPYAPLTQAYAPL
jgi:hypothetical protein